MAYEIDLLPVGSESRSGDAIALRYGRLGYRDEQKVVVIDGGTSQSGNELVEFIRKHYQTNRVDFVISTHPDCDHVNGLKTIVEEMDVGVLLMHKPWDHASALRHMFRDRRFTVTGLSSRLQRALADASELQDIAEKKQIKVIEPFAGVYALDQSFVVLGPDEDYYRELVCDFRSTPEPREAAAQQIWRTMMENAGEVLTRTLETMHIETLTDNGQTSAENNSSAILMFNLDGDRLMFTGDSGIPALTRAADFATKYALPTDELRVFQVPHHGSKRNVGPSILDRVRGEFAFISAAAKGAPKHPAKKVTNALIRRGSKVYSTCGNGLRHHKDAGDRNGWSTATPIPFYEVVED